MKKLLFIFLLVFYFTSSAKTTMDSLNAVWLNQTERPVKRCSAMHELIWEQYIYNNPDTAYKLGQQLYFFAQKNRLEEYEFKAVRTMGQSSFYTDRYKRAIKYYRMYLDHNLNNKNLEEVGTALHLLGMIKVNQGDLASGLEYYKKGLKIRQEINDTFGVGATLNNIGNVYYELKDWDICLDYYSRALVYKKQAGQKRGIANSYNNIGLIWHEKGELDSALFYYKQSLKMQREINNQLGLILCYTNIGALHEERGELDEALAYFKESLNIGIRIKNYTEVSNSYSNIAGIFKIKNQLDSALIFSKEGLKIAREIGSTNFIEHATNSLYEIYKLKGKDKLALTMYEEYIEMRDSLQSESVRKGLLEMEVKHEIEKEELEEEHRLKEAEMIALEKEERRNTLEYSGITLGLFILFGLVFLFGRFHLPNWAVELSVFLPFLILFEFILVLTDPFIDSFSNNDPMIKLLINACIAGLIFPLHGYFEKVLKQRLFKTE